MDFNQNNHQGNNNKIRHNNNQINQKNPNTGYSKNSSNNQDGYSNLVNRGSKYNTGNTHSNYPSTQNNSIQKYINELRNCVINMNKENSSIQDEIELTEREISGLIQHHFQLAEESIEKKIKFGLLRKEIEVKTGYLNSMMKINKIRVEESQFQLMKRVEKSLYQINTLAVKHNSLTNEFRVMNKGVLSEIELMDSNDFLRVLDSA